MFSGLSLWVIKAFIMEDGRGPISTEVEDATLVTKDFLYSSGSCKYGFVSFKDFLGMFYYTIEDRENHRKNNSGEHTGSPLPGIVQYGKI